MMLIHQVDAPTPLDQEAWAKLSEEEYVQAALAGKIDVDKWAKDKYGKPIEW